MSSPIGAFSGVASGIQWRDLVDQIMAAEQARSVTPLTSSITLANQRKTAWTQFQNLVQSLSDASKKLSTGQVFGNFTTTGGTSAVSGRALFSATASLSASPGEYDVEVLSLARAAKQSGGAVADLTTALGLSGSFDVAGQAVTLDAADSLVAVRDKINALNTGSTPSRVSATILSTGPNAHRLVLTAESPGSAGIALTDGASGALRSLGLLDSRSRSMASASAAVAATVGSASPGATTLRVGDRTIAVDLGVDSLDTIAARMRAAGVSASVVAEPFGDGMAHRLVVGANVTATADAGSADTLAMLQFGAGGQSADRQIVASGAFTASGGGIAGGGTSLIGLQLDGAATGIADGDAIQIRGVRGDGSVVTIGVTVDPTDTMETLLTRINDATSGFGAGSRPAEAVLGSDGKIRLVDGSGGDSQLSFSMTVVKPDGTSAALAAPTVEVTGRDRQLSTGTDARVRVDGVMLEPVGNSVVDAIPGVTLNLTQAEVGTVTRLSIQRDDAATITAVKAFATAYNAVVNFVEDQRATGKPLAANATLRSVMSSFTAALRTEVPDGGDFSRASVAGLALDRFGRLQVDETTFGRALATAMPNLQALFGANGIGKALVDATGLVTRTGDGTVALMNDSLTRQISGLGRRRDDTERRLAVRRDSLIKQFIAMESAVGRLQAQGTWLSGQVAALQK